MITHIVSKGYPEIPRSATITQMDSFILIHIKRKKIFEHLFQETLIKFEIYDTFHWHYLMVTDSKKVVAELIKYPMIDINYKIERENIIDIMLCLHNLEPLSEILKHPNLKLEYLQESLEELNEVEKTIFKQMVEVYYDKQGNY